jgi:general secretion pathway protein D
LEVPPSLVIPAKPAPMPVTTQPATSPSPAAPASDMAVVSFSPGGEVQSPLSGAVTLTLLVNNAKDLFAGDAIKVRFPAGLLKLNEVLQGEMLARDGQRVTFSKDIRNDNGEVTISVKRLPGAPGVNGQGTLLSFMFTAIAKGVGVVQFEDGAFKDSQLQPINVQKAQVNVRIQ